jgi:transcriptional regulator with XRE-family HTH domain
MGEKKFGAEFRRLRGEADKTMAEVADAMGCSVVYVSDIERDRRNPPLPEKIQKMLRAIGKENCLQEMLRLAVRTRQSVSISLKRNKGDKVTNMLAALARRADEGELDDQTAEKITKILLRKQEFR